MRAISVRYCGPTDHRGARLIADDGDRVRVTVSYDDALNRDAAFDKAALALCAKMKWTGRLVRGWTQKGAVYVFFNKEGFDQDMIEAKAQEVARCG